MRDMRTRQQAERSEQNRHFVMAIGFALGFNALFALIHTLGANSSLGETIAGLLYRCGFIAVGAMFIGAFVIGYQYNQPRRTPLALMLLATGILTQLHFVVVNPALAGLDGLLYYAVDVIVVVVLSYDTLLRVRLWRGARTAQIADVVELRSGSRHRTHRAA